MTFERHHRGAQTRVSFSMVNPLMSSLPCTRPASGRSSWLLRLRGLAALTLGAGFLAGSMFAAVASGPAAATVVAPTDNPWFLTQTIKGSQAGGIADWFGRGVAVDGTTALIGAPTTLTTGTSRKGAAYFMELEGGNWVEKQVMRGSQQTTASGPVDNYGYTVALQGDTAAVTAKTMEEPDGSYHGIVYLYTRSGGSWTEQAIVKANAADAPFDDFGQSLALDGDTLAVGAISYRRGPSVPQVGRVYVYVRNGTVWTLQATLEADDAGPFMTFGWSVALAGDTLLVGGPGNDNLARPGAVYAFQRSGTTWTQVQHINAPAAVDGDYFGTAVALAGDTAIIGAAGAEPGGNFVRGAAYVMQRNGGSWSHAQTLVASDGQALDGLGTTLAMHGDRALIGAPTASRDFNEQGLTYLFERDANGWSETRQFVSNVPRIAETYGFGMALSDDYALIGAPFGNGSSKPAAVYVYRNTDLAHLSFTPTSLDMGQTPVGYTSDPVAVTLANDGLSAAHVSAITLPTGPFTIESACGATPFTLEAGASCELRFRFAPLATQVYSTTATVESDAAPASVSLAVRGNGVAAVALLEPIEPLSAEIIEGQGVVNKNVPLHNSGTTALGWAVFDSPADASLIVHLDHSVSSTILPSNTTACAGFNTTRKTHYLRTFKAADFGAAGAFHVDEVSFGVQEASVAAEVRVRLHSLEGPMNFQNLRLLAEYPVTVEPQTLGTITVPVDVDLAPNATLVLELIGPDLAPVNGRFYPGSNRAGETGPSWYAAPDCGFPQPVLYSSMSGFPAPVVHLVLSASGHAIDCSLPSWLSTDPSVGSVAPFSSGDFAATFDATGLALGSYTGAICLTSNAVNRPIVQIPATLLVSPANPVLAVTPAILDFGNMDVGVDSAPRQITLASTGNVTIAVNGTTAPSLPFSSAAGSCPATPFDLVSGQSCTLGFVFSPRTIGTLTQSITVTSTAGNTSIVLSGVGVVEPRSIAVLGGSSQEAAVGSPFANPLAVQVRDALGRPMQNVSVTFSVPASGPKANLSAYSAQTDANGYAAVTAVAGSEPGLYVVEATVAAVGAPAEFTLQNRAARADVAIHLHTDSDFVRPGRWINYWVTVVNNGPDAAHAVDVSMQLPAQLDLAATRWICLSDVTGACTPEGIGALADSVDLAAGQSMAWLLTAPVLIDAAEANIHVSANATAAADPSNANNVASVVTQMALYRDGFDAYGSGTFSDDPVTSILLDAAHLARLEWVAIAPTDRIERVLEATSDTVVGSRAALSIERIAIGRMQWLRRIEVTLDGTTQVQPWHRADGIDHVWIANLPVQSADGGSASLVVSGENGTPAWQLSDLPIGVVWSLRAKGSASVALVPADAD